MLLRSERRSALWLWGAGIRDIFCRLRGFRKWCAFRRRVPHGSPGTELLRGLEMRSVASPSLPSRSAI